MPRIRRAVLTAARIPALRPGTHSDGRGLYLRVTTSGSRRWFLRLRVNGKAVARGLGGYPKVGLTDARAKAAEVLRAIRKGEDPAAAKKKAKETAKKANIPTFSQAALAKWELNRPGWSSEQHAREWLRSLEVHSFPTLGEKLVSEISAADVMAVLEPIWNSRHETATRVKQRIETVMDYTVAKGFRGDNPCAGVKRALPTKRPTKKAHFEALPYAELPAAIDTIRQSGNAITRLAVEFLIFVAARSGEVRGATWDEIDLDARVWEIPADRMKARRSHRVPLSDQAMRVLEEARERTSGRGFLFPSVRTGRQPMTPQALSRVLQRQGVNATIHGFRSSFRDWAAEQSGASWAVCESALAHATGTSTEQAYHRSDYLDARRTLMQSWGDYVTDIPTDHGAD